jgi:hypothetical protein
MNKTLALVLALVLSSETVQANSLTVAQVEAINSELCKNLSFSDSTGFYPERFNRIILEGIGVSESSADVNKAVSKFLNDHRNDLFCDPHSMLENKEKLLMKSALVDGVLDLFDEILLDDELYEIDFNGYEIVDGKKETLLDWIDLMIRLDRWSNDDLESIKEVIIDLGGKRGSEL